MSPFAAFFLAILAFAAAENERLYFKSQSRSGKPGKIMGGVNVDIKDVPYQISLKMNNQHRCGGALITDRHVLTAAHCVEEGIDITKLTVVLGTSDSRRGGDIIDLLRIFLHPNYASKKKPFDVAVLLLKRQPDFNNYPIKMIHLSEKDPVDNETMLISGWGALQEKAPSHPILQAAYVQVLNFQRCKQLFIISSLMNSMFCAGYEEGGVDACQGDSGGPAVIGDRLVGVVSWGRGCGRQRSPGVYTNVYYVLSWIRSVTGTKK